MESQRHEIDQMLEDFGRLVLSLVICAVLLAGMLISCVIF
jgi:hypothetical protein